THVLQHFHGVPQLETLQLPISHDHLLPGFSILASISSSCCTNFSCWVCKSVGGALSNDFNLPPAHRTATSGPISNASPMTPAARASSGLAPFAMSSNNLIVPLRFVLWSLIMSIRSPTCLFGRRRSLPIVTLNPSL